MNRKILYLVKFLTMISMILILLVFTALAQDEDDSQTRGIKSTAFTKNRPKPVNKSVPVKSYKYRNRSKAKKRRKSVLPKTPKPRPKQAVAPKEIETGVTLWRLRPPKPGETGPFVDVRLGETDADWTPERVAEDTVFQEGDRIRFTVESKTEGYIYIVNREVYEDDTTGDPTLIFPSSLGENNRVIAGMLIDIPDQAERYPYFNMDVKSPKRADYSGESVLVIISPNPLKSLSADEAGNITSLNVLEEIEENAEAEVFSRTDGVGDLFTTAEKEAACGNKTRQLSREKTTNDKPCGNKTRQLTRADPSPQTLYRSKVYPGQPVAFQIVLMVKANN